MIEMLSFEELHHCIANFEILRVARNSLLAQHYVESMQTVRLIERSFDLYTLNYHWGEKHSIYETCFVQTRNLKT